MNIGIVGLGLIGGSMAKAFKSYTDHNVFVYDRDESVIFKAKLFGAADGVLTEETLPLCDYVIISIYPHDTIDYVLSNAHFFKEGAFIVDTCGIKSIVCDEIWEKCKDMPFTFVGGHPMAGREFSGFDYAKKNLFTGASMILVPPKGTDILTLDKLKLFWLSIGFSGVQITTPAEHDKLIAFTSQLAHVVSSAYIKSPTAVQHRGFSAGSYKDMTRVAKLNEKMWTELFIYNREALCSEIDTLCDRLTEYSRAIKEKDEDALYNLLKEGCAAKALAEKRRQVQQ